MGESFFGPETGSDGGRPITDIERQRIRDGNYPLAGMFRADSQFMPRSEVEPGRLESREPLEEPADEFPTRSKSKQTSDNPLPRPAEPESDITRVSPSRDRGYPDKWAENGWGGPGGSYGVPTLNNGHERIENILADKPSRFDIRENPKADASDPWYASAWSGDAAIASYGTTIEKEAKRQGVDPVLAKAIVYSENARGHYFGWAKAAEGFDMADSFLPMNINPSIWGGLGIDRQSGSDYLTNIRAGITLIKRISDRIDNPTPEKVASIWNYTGRELVNDFGAYAGRMYRETPWDD